MKRFLFLFLFLAVTLSFSASATNGSNTVTGYGCNLGSRVYTQKIGTSTFWGDQFDVYNSNGTNYPIDWNNTSQCNYINANNIVDQKRTCWVNSYVNPTNNNSGVSYGTIVYYSATTCSTNPPVGLPLEDYIPLFMIAIGGMGAFVIANKKMNIVA